MRPSTFWPVLWQHLAARAHPDPGQLQHLAGRSRPLHRLSLQWEQRLREQDQRVGRSHACGSPQLARKWIGVPLAMEEEEDEDEPRLFAWLEVVLGTLGWSRGWP